MLHTGALRIFSLVALFCLLTFLPKGAALVHRRILSSPVLQQGSLRTSSVRSGSNVGEPSLVEGPKVLTQPVESKIEQFSKTANFLDDEVACNSEGGNWKVQNLVAEDITFTSSQIRMESDEGGFPKILADVGASCSKTLNLMWKWSMLPPEASNIVAICDEIDENKKLHKVNRFERLNTLLLKVRRQNIIPRRELPNVQGLPVSEKVMLESSKLEKSEFNDQYLDDCGLPKLVYTESILDKFLLKIFRKYVQEYIGFKSSKDGIEGLLEEGRHYKLSLSGKPEETTAQHDMVKTVLSRLLTSPLITFYRVGMGGFLPGKGETTEDTARKGLWSGDPDWIVKWTERTLNKLPETWRRKYDLRPGKQLGPLFYAPVLTSFVTPFAMTFLLGPAHMNHRKDGQLGGMVVEKCKFLQESNCKGLCLHQCKLPAQQFFAETLGVPLTVSPNFVTQECQWSWGESPLDHSEDPDFPKGCLRGCETNTVLVNVADTPKTVEGCSTVSP
eukprot:gene31599-38188_t